MDFVNNNISISIANKINIRIKHQLSINLFGIKRAKRYSIVPIAGIRKFRLTLKPSLKLLLLFSQTRIPVVSKIILVVVIILKAPIAETINPISTFNKARIPPVHRIVFFMPSIYYNAGNGGGQFRMSLKSVISAILDQLDIPFFQIKVLPSI